MADHVCIWETLDSHLPRNGDLLIVEIDEVIGAMFMLPGRPWRPAVHLARTAVLLDGAGDRASGIEVGVGSRPDGLLLRSHEGVVVRVLIGTLTPRLSSWNELDVVLLGAADVSYSLLSQLDAGLAVLLDDIAANVRVALLSFYYDAVVPTRVNDVLPDFGRAVLRATRTSDLDAVGVAPLNLILDQVRLVVIDLYANFVQVE